MTDAKNLETSGVNQTIVNSDEPKIVIFVIQVSVS